MVTTSLSPWHEPLPKVGRPASDGTEIGEIVRTISWVRERALDTFVAVCANTKAEVVWDDYDGFSVSSEYFSDAELSELIRSLQDNAIAAEAFSEPEMISFVVSGAFGQIPKKHKMVYSARGSGTGRSRSCSIPAICESYRVSTCSPDTYSLALAANKFHTFCLLRSQALPVPDYWLMLEGGHWLNGMRPALGRRVIIKPCYESASIGIDEKSVIFYSEQSDEFILRRCRAFKQPMIVQAFVAGYEVEVPVACLSSILVLPPVGIEVEADWNLGNNILDYQRVAEDAYDFYCFDQLNSKVSESLRSVAGRAAESLMLRGMCRIDFRVTTSGIAFITDVNLLPHLTLHSSCAHAIEALGFEHKDLMCLVVGCGMASRQIVRCRRTTPR